MSTEKPSDTTVLKDSSGNKLISYALLSGDKTLQNQTLDVMRLLGRGCHTVVCKHMTMASFDVRMNIKWILSDLPQHTLVHQVNSLLLLLECVSITQSPTFLPLELYSLKVVAAILPPLKSSQSVQVLSNCFSTIFHIIIAQLLLISSSLGLQVSHNRMLNLGYCDTQSLTLSFSLHSENSSLSYHHYSQPTIHLLQYFDSNSLTQLNTILFPKNPLIFDLTSTQLKAITSFSTVPQVPCPVSAILLLLLYYCCLFHQIHCFVVNIMSFISASLIFHVYLFHLTCLYSLRLAFGDQLWHLPDMCHCRGVSIGLVASVLNGNIPGTSLNNSDVSLNALLNSSEFYSNNPQKYQYKWEYQIKILK
ncbi:hypothetical protein VP01_4189g1 [Puccinia sorghi]|uniref:Uncharacterized protein n=1 Tax=Puccinia sorghi TaxID=27349 RepID=A0A0L6USU1_9BASI|nr:hypothetical protein VP01_4189g1 [Puccinia sorghi]